LVGSFICSASTDASGTLIAQRNPEFEMWWIPVAWALDWTPAPSQILPYPTDAPPGETTARAIAVGDFDGDGYDDVAVGVHDAYDSGNAGEVQVFAGGPGGLELKPSGRLHAPFEADPKVDPDRISTQFGNGLVVGDFDGDGTDDLAVGMPFWPGDALLQTDEGALAVYFGGGAGLDPLGAGLVVGHPGDQHTGEALFEVGDVDGDGDDDLVSAQSTISGLLRVRTWHGEPDGLSLGAFQYDLDTFGSWAVAPAGDTNGDGYADVLVSLYSGNGGVQLFTGGAAGLDPVPLWQEAGAAGQGLGSAMVVVDVTTDGLDDLLIASTQNEMLVHDAVSGSFASTATQAVPLTDPTPELSTVGTRLVVAENETLSLVPLGTGSVPTPPWTEVYRFAPVGQSANVSVPITGDVNGDGEIDLLVLGRAETLPGPGATWEYDAAVGIWYGTPSDPPTTKTPPVTTSGPTEPPTYSDPPPTVEEPTVEAPKETGCGCTAARTGAPPMWLALAMAALHRRRRQRDER
jgi:MYXO-CTERM domain-containing protein